ncbi:NUDIX hydrolase [Streptomyces sp. DSM 40750]|uniref:NUDIX hydrolase n=1 Tax=Streptomyces sp. DSM 40750 TaxID=2801030 RepID=UPI00214BD3AA|nr:NUDIX hydrolase [Streptomyces sp. DSM 40750]UUU22181.1 NUDIX hydrolase [Streptomyces sp. DSM 40750]
MPFKLIIDPEIILAWQARNISSQSLDGDAFDNPAIGVIWEDAYVLVIRDLVQLPNGNITPYIRVVGTASIQGATGVAVLAHMKGNFLLLQHFRHATRSWHLEIPRGFGTVGIGPEENARKELLEEAGGEVSDELLDLGPMHSDTGMLETEVRLFWAPLRSAGKPENSEGIACLKWVEVEELAQLIATGEISDSFTIAAFTRARLRGLL